MGDKAGNRTMAGKPFFRRRNVIATATAFAFDVGAGDPTARFAVELDRRIVALAQ